MSSRRIAWILAGVVVERHIDEYHDHDTREKPSSSGKTLNRQTRRRLEDKQSDTSRPHEVPVAAAGKEGGSDIEQKGTHDDMTSAIAARQLATTFLDQLLVMVSNAAFEDLRGCTKQARVSALTGLTMCFGS